MHPNTRLTPHSRQVLIDRYLRGEPVAKLAGEVRVSRKTVYRWIGRFREAGTAGLVNRSSKPRCLQRRIGGDTEEQILRLRATRRWGPLRIAGQLQLAVATVYRMLRRYGLQRLPGPVREPVRRYEATAPGALVHLDVMHLFALKGKKPALQFTVVDDYTRQAYAFLAPKRTAQAALHALQEAQRYFGYRFKAVLTDNDTTFTLAGHPHLWRDKWGRSEPPPTQFTKGCALLGITHRRTRVRRPQTNGKVERFHRTIRDECWRPTLFESEQEREQALTEYLWFYNHERGHSALNGRTPDQRRDTYLSGQEVLPTS